VAKRNWITRRKKTEPELPYQPPIWLGDHSNGEGYHVQTPTERRAQEIILREGAERARYYGMERREFMASGLGIAFSMSVLNMVNGCGDGSKGGFDPANGAFGGASGGGGTQPAAGGGGVGTAGLGTSGRMGVGAAGTTAAGGGAGGTGQTVGGTGSMTPGAGGSSPTAGGGSDMGKHDDEAGPDRVRGRAQIQRDVHLRHPDPPGRPRECNVPVVFVDSAAGRVRQRPRGLLLEGIS
jgi:hypothetical protein